jgi:hypothetical protein
MRVICAVRKDVDVLLLSVVSCMHHWLRGFPRCLSSYVVKWSCMYVCLNTIRVDVEQPSGTDVSGRARSYSPTVVNKTSV